MLGVRQEIALCGPGGWAPPLECCTRLTRYHSLGGIRTEEGIWWRANYLGNVSCEEQGTRWATEQVEEKTLQGDTGADFKIWEACFCVALGVSCHSWVDSVGRVRSLRKTSNLLLLGSENNSTGCGEASGVTCSALGAMNQSCFRKVALGVILPPR